MLVVQLGHGLAKRLDTGCRTIFTAVAGDVDLLGPLETALDLVIDLGSTLAQVCPLFRALEIAVLVGPFRGPHDAGGGTRGIEPSMGLVAFVGVAELTVDLGCELCGEGRRVSWGAGWLGGRHAAATHRSRWGPWSTRSACC